MQTYKYNIIRHNLFQPMIIGSYMNFPTREQIKLAIENHDFIEIGEENVSRIFQAEHVSPRLSITYFIQENLKEASK